MAHAHDKHAVKGGTHSMFSLIRKRFTYANAAMTLAFVFAMTGGAYAASKYVIISTKQIKPGVLAQLHGKAGAVGAQGAQGPQGPQGPAGANGKDGASGLPGEKGAPGEKGERGEPGTNGFNGSNGVSVTGKDFTGAQGPCAEGGSEFTGAAGSKTFACTGKEGSPWTDKGELPTGAKETGQWSFAVAAATESSTLVTASISFPIPLAAALSNAGSSSFIGPEEGKGEAKENLPSGCSGNYKEPEAASGHLCVFAKEIVDFQAGARESSLKIGDVETGGENAGRSGAYLLGSVLETKAGDKLVGVGDWVVSG